MIILNLILLILMAVCSALMDKIENKIQYDSSIFKKFKEGFWCKTTSAVKPLLRFTKYRIDAWHLTKSLWIVLLCIGLSKNIIEFFIYGIMWNLVFNLFYNKIFKKTKGE